MGGKVKYFIEPQSTSELIEILNYLRYFEIPWIVIGKGSNLLITNDEIEGAVIKLGGEFAKIQINNRVVNAGAAVYVPHLAKKIGGCGLSGVEHIVGIPASFGGLITMNGGSLRHSISENISDVKVLDSNFCIKTLKEEDCQFSYRDSIFKKDRRYLILEANMFFTESKPYESIRDKMLEILSSRNKRFPRKIPNCGSVFKSEPEIFETFGAPGKIIENLGLKGFRIGGAVISDKHANFILNDNNATSEDVLSIIRIIKEKTLRTFGIALKSEVMYLNNKCELIEI